MAPDRGGWWASKTKPTVCSSLIWAAIKGLDNPKITLEGKDYYTKSSDLETSDIGAQVDSLTRDGLYFYTKFERQNAVNWLYNYFYDLTYEEAGWLGTLFTDAPDDLASQVCNTFAFDWSGIDQNGDHAKDSDRWKDPEDGRAVSPDNIMTFWDPPAKEGDIIHGLYGYSEKLIYRPARLEFRRISRWKKKKQNATIKGKVLYNGNFVSGAVVKAAGEQDITDGTGEYNLTIPAGSYRLEASKVINGWLMSGTLDISVTQGSILSINITLQEPDELYREVFVGGSMYIVDDEWGTDETATRYVLMSNIRVGPYGTHGERTQIEKMGGEVRVELRLKFDWKLNCSVDMWYEAKLYEGTSEETNDLEDTKAGTINIPKDANVPLTIKLKNTEFDGGDTADITLNIRNLRQP